MPDSVGSVETDLADWSVPFPHAGHYVRPRLAPAMQVPHSIIETLGVEELHTYLRVAAWFERGESYDLQRLADEVWWGGASRAHTWVEALAKRKMFATAEAWSAATRAAVARQAELDAAAVTRARRAEEVAYLEEEWAGEWPPAAGPGEGVPVVYKAWDAEGKLAYIGSTGSFLRRMSDHAEHRRSLVWTRWGATACTSRPAAYRLEAAAIEEHKPYQNRPSARDRRKGADYVRSSMNRRVKVGQA